MKIKTLHNKYEIFLKKTRWQLLIILTLMIACFFSWSENVLITRTIKVIGRITVMIASYAVYRNILVYGAIDNLKWQRKQVALLYGAYLLLGLASFMWSTDVGYSALQWLMTTQILVFCFFYIKSLYLLDNYFPKHSINLFELLGNASFIMILIFVIGMWLLPDVFYRLTHGGEEARLGGFLMNPNELGMLACVGIAGLIFKLKETRKKAWTLLKLAVLFYALFATGSRSSLVGVLLIIGFHVNQSSSVRIKIGVLIVVLSLMPLVVNKIILKSSDGSKMEEVLSMTGRLPFWKELITVGLPREPLLGFGFMRIDYKDYFQGVHTYPGKMTHNTFIQALMNLGVIGLCIVLFQVFFTIKAIASETDSKRLMLWSILIPIMINSFTEFGIFGETNYGILFYQLIILYVSFRPGKILTPQQEIFLLKIRPDLAIEEKCSV